MQRDKILEILGDQNFWFKEQEVGIQRKEYLKSFFKKIKSEEVLVVSGVRRSGKSILLLQIAKNLIEKGVDRKNLLIVNFEDYRWEECDIDILSEIWDVYLQNIWKKGKIYVLLDEIYTIAKWEKFVRTLYDKKLATIFVSGSSSKLLSKEYATLLSGRYLELNVSPLSFKEFLVFNNFFFKDRAEAIAKRNEILKLLTEYMKIGGFPKVVLIKDEDLLKSYFETIVIKDVAERYKIKTVSNLKKLAVFYLTNISNKITFNSTSKSLNLSLHTVERFSYYLQEAYMCFFLNAFSYSLKSQEKLPKKFYTIDVGLSNAIGFKFSENIGRIIENIVFLHIKHRDVYYYPKEEVDFVVKEGAKIKQLIQVCYDIEDEKVRKREIKSLLKASEELKCKDLLIITWDFEDDLKIKNSIIIKILPLWKWLLDF
jgi:predicted AAA+ superfamily ATPase